VLYIFYILLDKDTVPDAQTVTLLPSELGPCRSHLWVLEVNIWLIMNYPQWPGQRNIEVFLSSTFELNGTRKSLHEAAYN